MLSNTMATIVEVSVEIQDGWRKERMRNVEKKEDKFWFIVERVLTNIFLNECENVIKNVVRIKITWAELQLITCQPPH